MPDFIGDGNGGVEGESVAFRAQAADSERWPLLFQCLTCVKTPAGKKRLPSEFRVTGNRWGLLCEFVDHNSDTVGPVPISGLAGLLDALEASLKGEVQVAWREVESWIRKRELKKNPPKALDKQKAAEDGSGKGGPTS